MPSLRSVAAVRTAPSRGYDARILDPLRTDTSVLDGTQPGSATTARLLVEETGRPPRVVVVNSFVWFVVVIAFMSRVSPVSLRK